MLNELPIVCPNDKIIEFCRKNHVRKLSFFGSILTDRFRQDSDVDMLIEFLPDKNPGFIELAGMELGLSDDLGRKVDLRTPAELSRYFRDHVVSTARVQYDRG